MTTYANRTTRSGGVIRTVDDNISLANSMWATCPLAAIQDDPSLAFVYYNDFFTLSTGEEGLAVTATNSGPPTTLTAAAGYMGGVCSLPCSDGSVADNDEIYLGSEAKNWILQAGKDLWFEARIKFTEANLDDANIIVGLSTLYNANILVDNGAGPAADYDGIVFFKVDGGTVWQGETSVATAQNTDASLATRRSGVWQRLGFHVAGGTTRVDFYIDGSVVGSSAASLPTAAMGLLLGAKNGDVNLETLYVDYVKIVQLR
jgi:hypothetical protein